VSLSESLDEATDGNRYDECPVCRHDEGLDGSKTHTEVQEHVEEEDGECHAKQSLAPATPGTNEE
jgi:hypothetical protein